jgi:biopolymer transport protein TolR
MAQPLLGRNRRSGRYRPLAEINVTPLVDVMLVLLIIFMVTAPLMSSAVNIDLPHVNASPINQDSEPLQVQVDAQGGVFLQDSQVQLPELVAKLQAISQDQKDRRIFVRGDKGNSYGTMLQVMGTIIQGGFTKVSLLTNPADLPTGGPAGPSPSGAAPATSPATLPPAQPPPQSSTPQSSGQRQQGRG